MRQLGDGRGLARSVDPDHQNDLRAREGHDIERLCNRAQDRSDFIGHSLPDRRLIGAAFKSLTGQPLADPGRGARAEVGEDQRVFDLVQLRVVQPGF
jgi:hypothetical protein